MKIDCRFCGAVNAEDVNVCISCNSLLREYVPPEEKFGVDRLKDRMGDTKMPTAVKGVLIVTTLVAGLAFYRHFTAPPSTDAVATAPAAAANANAATLPSTARAEEMLKGMPKVTPMVFTTPEFRKMTPEQISKMQKSACENGVKNMGPC